jgi:hypothetical protein
MPAGRPTLYKPEYAKQAYKLCLLGSTDKDLADFFEVEEQTVNNWKNDFPEFFESIKEGKVLSDANVANKLYHRAIGYEHPEIITASFQGQITDTMEVTKHYPPDPTAAIFWLKNRQPDKWRDRQEIVSDSTVLIETAEERRTRIAATQMKLIEGVKASYQVLPDPDSES